MLNLGYSQELENNALGSINKKYYLLIDDCEFVPSSQILHLKTLSRHSLDITGSHSETQERTQEFK